MKDDAVFWERIADMPAWEAEQEIVLRREQLVLENSMLSGEREKAGQKTKEAREIGVAIQENNAALTKCAEKIKYLRNLQNRLAWRMAVEQVCGIEAVEKCLIWMEMMDGDKYKKRQEWAK